MNQKADFTASVRLVWIGMLAVLIGVVCAFVAVLLLKLIGFFTNLFYYQQMSFEFRSPAENTLGWVSIFVPALGGLIIGLMARFGSERIRGHGIPEAIEAILIGRSRMQPKVAVLKPLSSAISIGSGGPFGAEGPIIMTGGAIGSIIAQVFHLTAAERKTLLVAGAAGGMTATFGTPVAAVLLAVELLLFEWKPRSVIPVALACAVATVLRPYLPIQDHPGPLFPVALHASLGPEAYLSGALLGLVAGALALSLTLAVYALEDAFHRLPIHWMWWPALGGLAVGVGGYFQPHALGVGYDIIEGLLRGDVGPLLGRAAGQPIVWALLALIAVKGCIWATALGSGTSGGVLAPLLIMGGAVGSVVGGALPGGDVPLWALVGMAAILGGTMRSPLTGTVFALELTHDINALPVLLTASVLAHGFTVLMMKRSILTEKIARRGYHVSREYSVDPLEHLSISEIMAAPAVTVPASLPVKDLVRQYFLSSAGQKHQGYPVVDASGHLLGVVTRSSLLEDWVIAALTAPAQGAPGAAPIIAYDLIGQTPITAFPWESCRTAAERMAHGNVGRLVIVAPDDARQVVGIVTRSDLLKARSRVIEEEFRREQFIRLRPSPPNGPKTPDGVKA
jgi:H+/Cl- antiporter ClcA